jgi:mono/diheme cytochrome c family protein
MRSSSSGIQRWTLCACLIVCLLSESVNAQTPLPPEITYDIVYVRAPRYGDDVITKMPEIKDPISVEAGTDLILLHLDGTEEVLVAGGNGTVLDPKVSFDGEWVFYAKIHDQTNTNSQRKRAARSGSDIYKINLATREIIQLTFQEWTPNTGVGNWSTDHLTANPSGTNYLGYGIYNLGPAPLPNGKLIFTSSRNGFLPNKSYTFPNLQLFVMDQDGSNVEFIGHLNLGSALHPTVLKDGRVMFSSYEAQGLRDRRLWGLWSIYPDGRNWGPLMSAVKAPSGFHWQTQLSDGSIVVDEYYNQNNNGFGMFLKFPSSVPSGALAFGSPNPNDPSNPSVHTGWFSNGKKQYRRYPFSPLGIESLTPFTHPQDNAAPYLNGNGSERTGKVTQPSSAPNNDLLLVWSPGPANHLTRPVNRPAYDAGLYLLQGGIPIDDHKNLIRIKNDPNYNEQQPQAVVSYQAIYGMAEPVTLPWLPNDGSVRQELPQGTPYGLVGTSSFYKRDTTPGTGQSEYDGLDPFNTFQNGASSNWGSQGADAGLYDNSEIHAVRIVGMEPTAHLSYGPNTRHSSESSSNWRNHASERLRILGEIPLRKYDGAGNPILDPEGNPDTSFLAKIPADVPFTFQTIDKDGRVLNNSQTWHQVRPGEVRNDCGGCHAHSKQPLDFNQTAAAQLDYQILDLANTTPLVSKDAEGKPTVAIVNKGATDVEYYRDIKPILQRSCVQCHSKTGTQEAQLVLDDEDLVGGYDNTYNRLANDGKGQYGIPALVQPYGWRQTNASRYVRKFQSRRSLLIWKIFGQRLDGWTNADHPSAAVPGDASTLPGGGDKSEINKSDIDYTGTIMPPPGSGVTPLTEDEKMLFARWVDLGAPISQPGRDAVGWFADESRPTLTMSSPRAGFNPSQIDEIRIGAHDYYTGLEMASLSVVANFDVDGNSAGTELAGLLQVTNDHVWTIQLASPLQSLTNGVITVGIKDKQGNLTTITRTFSVGTGTTDPPGGGGPQGQNSPPAIAAIAPQSVDSGDHVTFQILVSDPDATDTITLNAIGMPQGASLSKINNGLWQFDWQTGLQDKGNFSITFVANDGTDNSSPIVGGISVNAAPVADTTPPSNPGSFTPKAISSTQIDLSWAASTDNVGVTGYRVFHKDAVIADTTELSFSHIDLTPGTTYLYSIIAYDAEGNLSGQVLAEAETEPEEPSSITARLVARDQLNKEIPGAMVYISQTKEWAASGSEIELSVGETYSVRGKIGNIRGPWRKITIDSSMTEIAVPFWTTTLVAQDQAGTPVADAALFVHRWEDGPFTSGQTLSVPLGASIAIRGTTGAIRGPWIKVSIAEGLPGTIVPFWTTTLSARDQFGSDMPNAQLHVHRVEESPFSSGASLTLPKDSKISVRASLGAIRGPWKRVTINDSLTEIALPFWTVPLTAQDQLGNTVSNAEIKIHRVESSPFQSGMTFTVPKGAKIHIRGALGSIRGPWKKVTINESISDLVVSFWTAPLIAQDQFGANVPNAQFHVHRMEGSPFAPGTHITLPKGAKTSVRGKVGALQGPWSKQIFNDGLTKIIVPFWTTPLNARDEQGNNLPQAQINIHRWTGGLLSSGSVVSLPKGIKASVRGFVGTTRSRWTRVTFSDDVPEVIVTLNVQ